MPKNESAKEAACRRFLPAKMSGVSLEKRADGEPSGKITGYGAVFYNAADPGTEYDLGYDIVERVMPGAFDETIAADDIRASFNHDLSALLGRTAAGTLRLSVDDVGLKYEIDAPDTQVGRDVRELLSRGDVDGSSIWFVPTRVVWIEEEDRDIRQIEGVRLIEVGPVSWPAYESTTAETLGVRSAGDASELDAIRKELADRKTERRVEADRVNFRARTAAFDARRN